MGFDLHADPTAFLKNMSSSVDVPRRRDIPGRPPPFALTESTEPTKAVPVTEHEIDSANALDTNAAPLVRHFDLGDAHLLHGEDVRACLTETFPDPTGVEVILIDCASREAPLLSALNMAQTQLAARLGVMLDTPPNVRILAKALKEVSEVEHAVSKRIESLLQTLTALRSQRRLLETHRGGRR